MQSKPPGDDLPFKSACALVDAGRARGTGFLVTPDGVLTCYHVVREAASGARLQIHFAHGIYPARVDVCDPEQDCALLRLERPVTGVSPLQLAREPASRGAPFESYGFPAATFVSGLSLSGRVQECAGEDLARRVSLVLFSPQITAGAALQGFSGSPVLCGGRVIGQLRQIVPDAERGAQFGVVYACPAAVLATLVPTPAEEPEHDVQPPGCAYDEDWYIERPYEERRALARLGVRGGAVVLQGPPGCGKTWLMQHLLRQESAHSAIVHLSLRALSTAETAASYGGFLRELARRIVSEALSADAAKTSVLLDEAWAFSQDPVSNLSHLLGRKVLPGFSEQRRLLLALDDADSLGQRPYAQEFFSLLRAWMDTSHKAPWSALRLLMSLTRSPELLIQDPNRSPFNIAQTFVLRDLGSEQRAELATRHRLAWGPEDLGALTDLVGGHPYLLRLAMYEAHLTRQPLAEILQPGHGVYEEFLRSCERWLRKNPSLRQAFLRALSDPEVPLADEELEPLRCQGLLSEGEEEGVRIRYPLLRRLAKGRP
ncbi:MAG: AAA-like domain-containing protein [Polyangia bacterium]